MQASSVPNLSLLNAVDIRVKMMITALASVMTVAISSLYAQCFLFAVSFLYLLMIRRPKLILVSYFLFLIMMAIACGFGLVLAHFLPMMGKGMELKSLAVPFMRAFTMLNVVLPLAFTGRLQQILNSLQKLKLPFVIYLPAAVIVRFIPTFTNDIKQIWESLKIRGYRINPWTMTIHPFQTTRLLFTPLLIRALKTGDELGIAAELKGLNANTSAIKKDPPSFTKKDYAAVSLTAAVLVAAVILQIYFPNTSPVLMK